MKPGERIKILRMLSGFTQETLAKLAGVNRVSVLSWERGDYKPSAAMAQAMGKILLCHPGYLIFGTPSLESSFWEPELPKTSKYLDAYVDDFRSLFPPLCAENQITSCTCCSAEDGNLLFLGIPGSPSKILLCMQHVLFESFSPIFAEMDFRVIAKPKVPLCPLPTGNVDTLSPFFHAAQVAGVSIDRRDKYGLLQGEESSW